MSLNTTLLPFKQTIKTTRKQEKKKGIPTFISVCLSKKLRFKLHGSVRRLGLEMAEKPEPNGETRNSKFLRRGEACLSGYGAGLEIGADLGKHLALMERPDKIRIGDRGGIGGWFANRNSDKSCVAKAYGRKEMLFCDRFCDDFVTLLRLYLLYGSAGVRVITAAGGRSYKENKQQSYGMYMRLHDLLADWLCITSFGRSYDDKYGLGKDMFYIIALLIQQVHKQIINNPYTSFGFVMSLNDYRGLDVPTAKLFLIPTGKLMVPAGSSWFLLVVPAGRLCGSYWSAYGFCC
ncbi:hypothetical protein Tco_1191391 [Tanacetum coccineum]